MADRSTPTLPQICVAICEYLGEYDAHIDVLAEHCGCSVTGVRRALEYLRKVGVPIKHIRHHGNGSGLPTEHYWRLEQKLKPGEATAYVSLKFAPGADADHLLALAQSQELPS